MLEILWAYEDLDLQCPFPCVKEVTPGSQPVTTPRPALTHHKDLRPPERQAGQSKDCPRPEPETSLEVLVSTAPIKDMDMITNTYLGGGHLASGLCAVTLVQYLCRPIPWTLLLCFLSPAR